VALPPGEQVEHLGRKCVRYDNRDGARLVVADTSPLTDGWVEAELAVGPERSFHGVVWRVLDDENYESFFVRPHQVGNPDAIQYTPVFNGVSSWQLYHGPGYWAPTTFPIDAWFRIRVSFAGSRGEVELADSHDPVLAIGNLRLPARPGGVGVLVGGENLHVASLRWGSDTELRADAPPAAPRAPGTVPAWWISDAFGEGVDAPLEGRRWTRLESEPSGLVDLARANRLSERANTVYARTVIRATRAGPVLLELGFSDRVVLSLNGRRIFRGEDAYRSRDYRFLGSIGYYDGLYLDLATGNNELVAAVSEDFGGWGIQARVVEADGISFPPPTDHACGGHEAAGAPLWSMFR